MAKEILQEISQLQLQKNLENLNGFDRLRNNETLEQAIGIQLQMMNLTTLSRRICLRVLIVSEQNNLSDRINLPIEIVTVQWSKKKVHCEFIPVEMIH